MSGTPFQIPIHDLSRQAGRAKALTVAIPAPAGFGTDVVRIEEGIPLAVDLRLETASDGVYVSGEVRARLSGECVRCLDMLSEEATFRVADLFLYPEAAARALEEGDEEAADMFTTDGDTLDLEPLLRDSVIADLPFTPLCREDCPGLCPTCGIRLDSAEPGHGHRVVDPRFAALGALLPESMPGRDVSELPAIADGAARADSSSPGSAASKPPAGSAP